ncbi:alpha/beta fold hydrolase [Streptomyces sp. NPDC058614]|uniref:alpha/beta fold hydrolase n=1 Tax=Streptomyces sp. NPDC058614 TaxID=3346557 RepID=UPI00365FC40B
MEKKGRTAIPYADVNGARLYFEDSGGEGPVVVFSHGNLMDCDMWAHQIQALAGDFRVVVWDERLHGRTEDDGEAYTYWDSAADLIGLLDHLDVRQAALVGHSQGGFLSMRAALLTPDRVKALVLIDTTSVAWPHEALAQMRGVSEGFRGAGPEAVAPILLGMLLGQPAIHDQWLVKWKAQPRERLADAVQVLMGADDITGRLGEITVPALVVHGDADQPIPYPLGQALAGKIPGTQELVTVTGAGHTPNLTHPERVNPALDGFLRRFA